MGLILSTWSTIFIHFFFFLPSLAPPLSPHHSFITMTIATMDQRLPCIVVVCKNMNFRIKFTYRLTDLLMKVF
jgi:hypothetical protein